MQNLCDNGALIATGEMLDGTQRMHYQGKDVPRSALIGAFAEYGVLPEWSCIKIPEHLPLLTASLVGCGVLTGWGSAVNAAQVQPGHVVIVMGIGASGSTQCKALPTPLPPMA
jgi:Zn-dependent alcohol dehydrogenase